MIHAAPFRALLFAAFAGLAGCTYPAGPGSTNLVDGSYQGASTLVTSTGPACPAGQYGTIEIGDRVLDYGYLPNLTLEAPIKPDGTLHAVAGTAVIDGKLDGEHLAFTITTPECQSSYDTDYIWNHS